MIRVSLTNAMSPTLEQAVCIQLGPFSRLEESRSEAGAIQSCLRENRRPLAFAGGSSLQEFLEVLVRSLGTWLGADLSYRTGCLVHPMTRQSYQGPGSRPGFIPGGRTHVAYRNQLARATKPEKLRGVRQWRGREDARGGGHSPVCRPNTSPELAPLFAFFLFWGFLCFPLAKQKQYFFAGVLIPANNRFKLAFSGHVDLRGSVSGCPLLVGVQRDTPPPSCFSTCGVLEMSLQNAPCNMCLIKSAKQIQTTHGPLCTWVPMPLSGATCFAPNPSLSS